MKNLIQNTIALVAAITLFSSCAFHTGNFHPSASLTNGNYKLVKVASGHAQTYKIFGIGGLSAEAMVFDAKQDLYKHFPLKAGQVLANTTVDFKRGYYPFFTTTKVTLTGEIVEFTPATLNDADIRDLHLITADTSFLNYKTGQNVIIDFGYLYKKAQIVDFKNGGLVVRTTNPEYPSKTSFKNIKPKRVYTLDNENKEKALKLNQFVKISTGNNLNYNSLNNPKENYAYGQVIGFGNTKALVYFKDKKGTTSAIIPFGYSEILNLNDAEKAALEKLVD